MPWETKGKQLGNKEKLSSICLSKSRFGSNTMTAANNSWSNQSAQKHIGWQTKRFWWTIDFPYQKSEVGESVNDWALHGAVSACPSLALFPSPRHARPSECFSIGTSALLQRCLSDPNFQAKATRARASRLLALGCLKGLGKDWFVIKLKEKVPKKKSRATYSQVFYRHP